MKRIETVEELKKIQLDILLSFHQFCVENDIKYSLAAGSLIGAVRHKGFIPWDDDIDVYLMRDQYNELIAKYPKIYQGHYSLVTMERDNQWHRSFGKLCDTRTVEVEDVRNKYPEIGIGIDVFPIDDAPDKMGDWLSFDKKRRFWRDMMTLKSMTYSAKRSWAKNAFMYITRVLLTPFSFSYLAKRMDKQAQSCNGKGYCHVYESCLGVYNSKHPWKKTDLQEVIEAPFEGHTIHIMKGYDDYLKTVYGDYMKLPPEGKRVSTHTITAWWK